jgi:nucleotide-binding universal stress UspA family protein
MYKRILVTLDQSQLAEQALPHALEVAKAFGACIDLLSVVPIYTYSDDTLTGPVILDWEPIRAGAEEYLGGVASRVREAGVECTTQIERGDVAEEILRFCAEAACDLIVMSTHGRSGLGRWVYGSIADKVLRHAKVPVLLVRVSESDVN